MCCKEGLAAVSLAACFVKVYKAQNSAHPQFGTELRRPAGIWVICSEKGTRRHSHERYTAHL